jgi:hypothetical protein
VAFGGLDAEFELIIRSGATPITQKTFSCKILVSLFKRNAQKKSFNEQHFAPSLLRV